MTIKEVAKIAGVSPAAVSRYMNGGSVSEAKKESIRRAIEKTGYRPSTAARVMRTGKLNQIGIIVPRIYSDSVSQIVEGVNDRIRDEGYMLVVCSTDGDEARELNYIELMENNRAAGVIVMGTANAPHRVDGYLACRMPLVITGQNISGLPCVYHDDIHALEDLTKRLIDVGRRKIAYLGVPEQDPQAGKARREGVERAFTAAGRQISELIRVETDFDAQVAYEKTGALLAKHPDIDGVICATDTIATGAMRALAENGRIVGEDISIVGVGDNWMNNFMSTPLTTAHFFFRQCGKEAANMLLDAIGYAREKKPFPIRQVCLEYNIIDRGSI